MLRAEKRRVRFKHDARKGMLAFPGKLLRPINGVGGRINCFYRYGYFFAEPTLFYVLPGELKEVLVDEYITRGGNVYGDI